MGKRVKCRVCNLSFIDLRSVMTHMESIHNMRKIECKLCNKAFVRLDILYKHFTSKTHKANKRHENKIQALKLTNESLNKARSIGNHDKLVSYNTVGSINDSTSNIEVDDFDEDVDEEIDSTLPIIYSYDDEDSILSLNWEDSIEQLKAAAAPVQDTPNASFNSTVGRAEQTYTSTGRNSLPTQFEGNVFTYSELLRIAKREEDNLNAAGPSNEAHQIRLGTVIKAENEDHIITINSDDELPPDKPTSPAATTSKTKKTLYGKSVISPEQKLTEPVGQISTPSSSKSLHRENDVRVDSNVFDLLKKKTLDSHDEDQMFLLSILSDFRKVLPQNKLKVKIKIAQAIAGGL